MVLLVLALAWGAVLFFWFRSRSQGSFSDSVGLFHRHLHVLERAAPGTLAPANRMRGPRTVTSTPRPAVAGQPLSSRPRHPGRTSGAQVVANARRRQTQRRRRDVLFVLGVVVLATLVVAAVTRGTDAILAQLLSDLALGGYVALLVRIRNLAAERELKLRPLTYGTAPARRRPAARQPLTPAYAMASGYGSADPTYGMGGYGDTGTRRAAGDY
jgi:hypothetical protein